ncbi:MAG: FAD-dependent oxidoreductase [Armatimonadota bacterium]
MKVAVVGAGIMGASTALSLIDRGHSVTIFDQFLVGHQQGSSHGRSRIVRKAYVDAFYTRIMLDGYPMWWKLQERLGKQILFETGLVYFAKQENPEYSSLVQALVDNEVKYEVYGKDGIHKVFPTLALHEGERACFSADGGWVRADQAVSGTVKLACDGGATLVQQGVADPKSLLAEFDSVVVCAGAWAKSMFTLPVKPTLQTFAYLQTNGPQRGPVWIHGDDHNVYGIPSEPGQSSIKFGVHSPGPDLEPESPDRPVIENHLEILKTFAKERFGDENPLLLEPTTCVYTRTTNEDFLWGQAEENLFWVSPCSGHGFKFGPWIGERMADMAEGSLKPEEEPRFAANKNGKE